MTYDRLEEILEDEWKKIKDKIISDLSLGEAVESSKLIPEKLLTEIRSNIMRIRKRRGLTPPLCAFKLAYDENNDLIINRLKENGLTNKETDNVKVIFYPVYLNKMDVLLGMDYREAVTACSVGVFLSRYEPFGYTPLEAATYASMSVTSDYGGFGRFILENVDEKNRKGIFVVSALEKSYDDIVKQTADILESITSMKKEERMKMEVSARKVAELCSWKDQINNYTKAYDLALKRMFGNKRP